MATLAKAGCIVATGDVLEQAGERVEARFVPLGGEAVEKLNLDLYEVAWGETPAAAPAEPAAELTPYQPDPRSKFKTSSRLRPRATVSGMAVRKVTLREVKLPPDEVAGTLAETVPAADPAAGAAPAPPESPAAPPPRVANRLCLIWREKVLQVDSKTSVTVGRDAHNDIVLQVETASRHHADVCYRNGQFVVVDHSANGTFIYDDRGEEFFVQQREAKLPESGAICPGCPQEEPGCEALLYWVTE